MTAGFVTDALVMAIWRPYMVKNKSYEYEQEVRALVVAGQGHEIGKEGCQISIAPSEFIDEIIANPFSGRWFIEAVSATANQFGLGGKSKSSSLAPDVFYGRTHTPW